MQISTKHCSPLGTRLSVYCNRIIRPESYIHPKKYLYPLPMYWETVALFPSVTLTPTPNAASTRRSGRTQLTSLVTAATYDFEHPERELFIWSLLFNRRALAQLFWRLGQDHIGGALLACAILKAQSRQVLCFLPLPAILFHPFFFPSLTPLSLLPSLLTSLPPSLRANLHSLVFSGQ